MLNIDQLVKKVIVQGMTGAQGMKHTDRMLKCGTNIVGGVNPKKAGEVVSFDSVNVPVFGTVQDAVAKTGATASVVFVPPRFAKSAVVEAVEAGIDLIVVITEGIALQDEVFFAALAKERGVQIVGPNCPGLVVFDPEEPQKTANLGIIPDGLAKFGPIGFVSKSGTLTYEVMESLGEIGFKACIGIGGDPCPGTTFIDALEIYNTDPAVKMIVLVGEIGGDAEEQAAAYIKQHIVKPVVAYIVGKSAPMGKTMGHAGAIISPGSGDVASKTKALEAAGVTVVDTLSQVASAVRAIL
ncbi:succinate--CoA ligase [ADP-forming] subunit alpha [Actinomycetota bacterium]|nr:succinate--CoA ligase [ADP-forming] subunit alpha [Actinomycetota bacterium]